MYYSVFQEYICFHIQFTLNFRVYFLQTKFPVVILPIFLLQNQDHLQKIRAQSTIFYCYIVLPILSNLANVQLFFTEFNQFTFYFIPTLILSLLLLEKPDATPFTDIQRITLRLTMCIKAYFLNQHNATKLTSSEK